MFMRAEMKITSNDDLLPNKMLTGVSDAAMIPKQALGRHIPAGRVLYPLEARKQKNVIACEQHREPCHLYQKTMKLDIDQKSSDAQYGRGSVYFT